LKRARMFLWMAARSTLSHSRRGRVLTALTAIVTAAAVATAILNLSRDVEAKLHGELRSYGANLVLAASEGTSLPADSLSQVEALLGGHGVAVPFAYAVARDGGDSPVVVAGIDFGRVRKMNSWWQVSDWPTEPNAALLGVRAAQAVSADSKPFELTFKGRRMYFTPTGTLRTGGAEESRVYINLPDFFTWTGVQPTVIEISANLPRAELSVLQRQLADRFPGAQVREMRQITEAEANVFDKTRAALLASVVLIVLVAGLCVLANLTSSVLDRRKDFAIMKALGASQVMANSIFAVEALFLGALGASIGYLIGVGVAAWIGRASLHQAVLPRLDVFPPILLASILLTLVAAMFPLRLLRGIQPAAILKGE
jgi:putative ABC transport system permease protein